MIKRALVVAAVLIGCGGALGQTYFTDFESYTVGPLEPQDGWYTPVTAPPSTPFDVRAYFGNVHAFPQNPQGGAQFSDARNGAGAPNTFGRGQHDHNFAAGGVWTFCYDFAAKFAGVLPANDNLGSFSLQPSTTAEYFQSLMTWADLAGGTTFNHLLGTQVSGGGAIATFQAPSAAWQGLPVNHWFRVTITINFTTHLYERATLYDLHTNAVLSDVNLIPNNWFLGNNATGVKPTAIRIFAGGGAGTGPEGNIVAWDNISVGPGEFECPPASTCEPCDTNCDGSVNLFDINSFVDQLSSGDPGCSPCSADANADGSVNLFDIADFVACLSG